MRMDALINSVLEYSRIGCATIKDEPIDLSVLLREVLEMLNPQAAIDRDSVGVPVNYCGQNSNFAGLSEMR